MLKIYTYSIDAIWPHKEKPGGSLRLDDQVEQVVDPDAADFVIVPPSIHDFENRHLDIASLLPHLKGREEKHVWVEVAECFNDHVALVGPGVFFHCACKRQHLEKHPTAISFPWPVEDLGQLVPKPPNEFKYDGSFQGWLSCAVRKQAFESCRQELTRVHLEGHDMFYGYYENTDLGRARKASYLKTLSESRVLLCPSSQRGVFPYRFFEAMSAGRIPALVCDDYILPFADKIPYHEFCIFISEAE